MPLSNAEKCRRYRLRKKGIEPQEQSASRARVRVVHATVEIDGASLAPLSDVMAIIAKALRTGWL